MTEPTGLRDRKKHRTRETIVRVAQELFTERGYHETTVSEIAAAAEVAASTVFSYFPRKGDILFADHPRILEEERRWLEENRGTPTIELLHQFAIEVVPRVRSGDAEWLRTRRAIVDGDPDLRAQEYLRLLEHEKVLAEAVARETGELADDLRPQLLAAASVAVFVVAWRRRAIEGPPAADEDSLMFDYALAFLRGGSDAVRDCNRWRPRTDPDAA